MIDFKLRAEIGQGSKQKTETTILKRCAKQKASCDDPTVRYFAQSSLNCSSLNAVCERFSSQLLAIRCGGSCRSSHCRGGCCCSYCKHTLAAAAACAACWNCQILSDAAAPLSLPPPLLAHASANKAAAAAAAAAANRLTD